MNSNTAHPAALANNHSAPTVPLEASGRLALRIIAGSLGLGVAGDALLRAAPWGVNFVVWFTALLAMTIWMAGVSRRPLDRRAVWPGVAAWLFAGGLVWRGSEALTVLNLGSAALLLALGLAGARGRPILIGGVAEHIWRIAGAAAEAVAGFIPLFLGQAWWTPQAAHGWGAKARSVAIGGLLALPLLVLFGGLMASADVVFRDLLGRIFDFNLPDLISHVVPIGVLAWLVAGWLTALSFRAWSGPARFELRQWIAFGPAEIGVALGLVNGLFLAFLAIQVRYLFGGAELVQITPGLTYAEYARRGFFELVAVVALAVPALLAADWLLGSNSRRSFRWQAASMVALLAVILGSAWHRMRLYQAEYGWTELRFMVTAFMAWLAAVLGWFALTVLTGRRDRFTGGAILAALALVAVLNGWNPAAWIAERNLERAETGRGFDADYAARLSEDAVPVLLRRFDWLSPTDQAALVAGWRRRMAPEADWRCWNWARAKARRQLLAAGVQINPPAPRRSPHPE